jgi:diguanylate cyclase (GGDEF)-like protein
MEEPIKDSMLIPEERITRLEGENAMLRIAHTELITQIEELSKNAFYDRLTGLKSRAFFEEEMKYILGNIFQKKYSRERRQETGIGDESACLIIFDLDKFKNVNDSLGHLAGDEVLKAVAKVIQDLVRDFDIAARWGGEEIALVLTGATSEEAMEKAENIRQKVSEIKFEQYPNLAVTISAGIASASDFEDQASLFNAADRALYQSKDSGRNKVTAHSK